MAEYIEREKLTQYYVIRDKNTGLYFRGKGVNRWGKHYNQATIYRVKGTAEHTIKEIAWRGAEQAEIVPIRIVETTADVVEVRHGRWVDNGDRDSNGVPKPFAISCSVCGSSAGTSWMQYCPNCGARMDGKGEGE